MTPELSRRDALRFGAASASLLAGCTGSDDGSQHPDAGIDSYAVRAQNGVPEDFEPPTASPGRELPPPEDLTYEVDLRVDYAWSDDESPWAESVTLEPGDSREWQSVITGDREQVLVAKLPEREAALSECNPLSAVFWVTPGSDTAPDVTYLDVVVDYPLAHHLYEEDSEEGERVRDHAIYVDHDELDRGSEDGGPYAWDFCE